MGRKIGEGALHSLKTEEKKRKKGRTGFRPSFALSRCPFLIFNPRVVSIGDDARQEIFANYRDRMVNILLEYWILLRIGYPLWILRVGGIGLDNHFQPSLSLSLSRQIIMGRLSMYLLRFVS